MLKWIVIMLVTLCAMPAFALDPVLKVTDGGSPGELLTMTRIQADVRVHDMLAETKVTMTFGNHLSRPVAADLYFPLPEGAVVSGYALDINGVMVDGVAVEREKARVVFEQEVRKGVDPGLVEKVSGNNYKTRVFPIPAKGSRTIMIRYISRLTLSGDDAIYDLPLHFSKPVDKFDLRVEVVKPSSVPEVRKSDLANFSFSKWRDSFVAETALHNVSPREDLRIALPDVVRRKTVVETTPAGDTYFIISDPPGKVVTATPQELNKIAILWDASGSRGEISHEREFNLLRKLFSIHRAVEVELTVFRNTAEKAQRIKIRDGNAEPLITLLTTLVYDGGTQMGSLGGLPEGFKPDAYLLFSDGLGTIGSAFAVKTNAPLYAVSLDPRTNHGLLRLISGENGGSYINLAAVTDDEAAAVVGSPVLRLMEVRFTPGEIEMVYPLPGSEVVPGTFSVSGKLLAKQAEMILVYGVNGKDVSRKSYHLSGESAVSGTLVETYWAVQRLEALEIFPKKNRDEIVATSKRFGLTTSETSLIVLENLNQYVQHKILPPASLPEMRRQYTELLANRGKEIQTERQRKIDRIADLWAKRVAWWKKEFTYPKNFSYQGEKSKTYAEPGEASPPRVMAMPAPAAMAEPPVPIVVEMAESPVPVPVPVAAVESARQAQREATERRAMAGAPPPTAAASSGFDASPSASGDSAVPAQIAIKAWDPETPYIALLKKSEPADRYNVYMEQKKAYGRAPGFYFDCAEFFLSGGNRELAIRILSNLAEMELENASLLRVLAHRLSQIDELDLSIGLFEEVLRLRPEEAQSHRDLALVLARRGERDMNPADPKLRLQARSDLGRAAQLLYTVVENEWQRNDEIELIALMELNRIMPMAAGLGAELPAVDKRLINPMDLDLRIVLSWDMDMTDLDLWVTEPSKEKSIYSHPDTTIGGHLSHDVTGGYGPEEYALHRGMTGEYTIDANFYGNRNPGLAGIATLQVEIFTNYGRKDEKRQVITKRLDSVKDVVSIGSVVLGHK